MPLVDFYVLNTSDPAARREFVARLLGTIQRRRKTVWIAVADEDDTQLMDRLLWGYPPESFLPHAVVEAGAQPDVPVLISSQPEAQPLPDVYVNLRNQLPPQHGSLERLVEVVIEEPSVLTATRDNYRFYREQGYEVRTHKIAS